MIDVKGILGAIGLPEIKYVLVDVIELSYDEANNFAWEHTAEDYLTKRGVYTLSYSERLNRATNKEFCEKYGMPAATHISITQPTNRTGINIQLYVEKK